MKSDEIPERADLPGLWLTNEFFTFQGYLDTGGPTLKHQRLRDEEAVSKPETWYMRGVRAVSHCLFIAMLTIRSINFDTYLNLNCMIGSCFYKVSKRCL